ncbi:MAG: TldD/PmbA family protein [Acetobacteraceae bacterium]|nr:TldD/PmbA family protein [Acetobacteraceae bacterium]
MTDPLELLHDLIGRARRAGADAADAVLASGTSLSVQRRLGQTEHVERSEGQDLGLRVFVGKRSAIVSSSAIDRGGFDRLAERAVAMARAVPEDPYGGLAAEAVLDTALLDAASLDLADAAEPDTEALVARASQAEEAALSVPGITNSEGAEAGYSRTALALATSAGFAGRYARTGHSVSVTALAGEGTGMQRDYDYSSAVHLADLEDAREIGLSAAHRAIARLDPRRPKTTVLPVVYHPRVAGGLVGHLLGAINGASVARGTTFLKDKLGQRVLPAGIDVFDDPRRVRGLRSRPFDGEGVGTSSRPLVEDGVLATWLLDSRTGRQLGMPTTGHAARAVGGPPSPAPSNVYMAAGRLSPAELMADIGEGLFVTELIGMGINGLTGDYSRGAAGFMIRDGVLAEPVAEITIAGNLLDMFATLTAANDLQFKRGTDAPTLRVERMTMAGA